jgi:hypothetical protein
MLYISVMTRENPMTSTNRPYTEIRDEQAWDAGRKARIEANIAKGRPARAERFAAEHADAADIERFLARHEGRTKQDGEPSFLAKMHEHMDLYGELTPAMLERVRGIMADDAEKKAKFRERDAASAHVGAIGERLTLTLTVSFATSYESDFGTVNVVGLRDAAGNIFVQKGRWSAEKGTTVTIKATVKEHGERDGVRQTIIARVVAV